jgi:hypothetical protein
VPPGIPVNPWPLLVDAEGWPLLIDPGKWGAAGTDLGANTEHNGRTYIFFGDVAPTRGSGIPINADMVAWIDDQDVIFHGGHLALGWNFILPFQPTSDWRFCGKCGSLFWDGDPNIKGFCHKDQGIHVAIGLNFVIPAAETGAHDGQPNWSFCGKCGGLFWNGDPAFNGVCPKDGQPHFAIGWNFHLPFVTDVYIPTGRPEQADWRFCGKVTTLDLLLSHPSFQEDGTHQGNWRFCGKCARLFWDGDFKFKGLCPKDGAGHSPIGLNFMLPHDVPEETQHQQQWRFCGKCGGLSGTAKTRTPASVPRTEQDTVPSASTASCRMAFPKTPSTRGTGVSAESVSASSGTAIRTSRGRVRRTERGTSPSAITSSSHTIPAKTSSPRVAGVSAHDATVRSLRDGRTGFRGSHPA